MVTGGETDYRIKHEVSNFFTKMNQLRFNMLYFFNKFINV
jgi:hypothetical protein